MSDEHSPQEAAQIKKNRFSGLLVLGAIVLPMVAAYLVFKTEVAIPTSTINKGDLLTPAQPVSDLNLKDLDGQPFDILAGTKHWRILIPGFADCNQQCMETLYLTRQVHTRLSEKANRVHRYYLTLDGRISESLQQTMKDDYPYLKVATLSQDDFDAFISKGSLAGTDGIENRYFIMDQEGFVMMSYTPEHSGNELLTDIKRLLRYSYEE